MDKKISLQPIQQVESAELVYWDGRRETIPVGPDPTTDRHEAFVNYNPISIGELRPQHVGRKVQWHTLSADVTGTLGEVSFKRGGVAVSIRIEESSGVKGVLYLHEIPRETLVEIES